MYIVKEAAGKRDECGRDFGKAEINKKTNNKNKCRIVYNENKRRTKFKEMEREKNELI